jgi:hypothetical protein
MAEAITGSQSARFPYVKIHEKKYICTHSMNYFREFQMLQDALPTLGFFVRLHFP